MALRNLRIYNGPELGAAGLTVVSAPRENAVRIPLGDVLPLLADAVASNRTWLTDFADDEIEISSDLNDVLQAYRHFRRPSA
jgi:hypothetical protein